MDEIYHQALKLLRRRDYTTAELRAKLVLRFGDVPEEIIETLLAKRFLDDTRYAANFVSKHRDCHPSFVLKELRSAGISLETAEQTVANNDWPSLQNVLRAKMNGWKLQAPIHNREAARLFRTLVRLGYPEDEIREELEQLHEQ